MRSSDAKAHKSAALVSLCRACTASRLTDMLTRRVHDIDALTPHCRRTDYCAVRGTLRYRSHLHTCRSTHFNFSNNVHIVVASLSIKAALPCHNCHENRIPASPEGDRPVERHYCMRWRTVPRTPRRPDLETRPTQAHPPRSWHEQDMCVEALAHASSWFVRLTASRAGG